MRRLFKPEWSTCYCPTFNHKNKVCGGNWSRLQFTITQLPEFVEVTRVDQASKPKQIILTGYLEEKNVLGTKQRSRYYMPRFTSLKGCLQIVIENW
jgi:hypothetical protein